MRIQEEQYSFYVPLLNNFSNSLVVLIDLGEESHPSLILIRSEATVYLVVYSGPARPQHRFSPNYSCLGNMVKMSASHSVPNLLNILGVMQGASQTREPSLLQDIEENEHIKPKHLFPYACSQYWAMREQGLNTNYSVILVPSHLIPSP